MTDINTVNNIIDNEILHIIKNGIKKNITLKKDDIAKKD